jgi:hypothetical protein
MQKNKEILLSDAWPHLAVGMHILFNGDGAHKGLGLIAGVIKSMATIGENRHRVSLLRDDGRAGGEIDSSWFIECSPTRDTVTVMVLDTSDAVPVDPKKLVMGDIVTFVNGPYEYIGSFVDLTEADVHIKLFVDPTMAGSNSFMAVPRTVGLTRVAVHQKMDCSQRGCTRAATVYASGKLFCASHAAQLGLVVRCGVCGKSIFDHTAHHQGRAIYCPSCYDERLNGVSIRAHSYKPLPRFMATKEEQKNGPMALFAGVEMEVECRGREGRLFDSGFAGTLPVSVTDPSGMAAAIQEKFAPKKNPWFYIKYDSSISNGFELVTHPATVKAHEVALPWAEMLAYMQACGIDADNTATCGLHVHVNKNYMTEEEQIRLGYFINTHKGKMEDIARRSSARWSKFKDTEATPLEELNKCLDSDRYQAVNWQNTHTVEFRMFKGTVNYEVLMGTLQFVQATVEYVKSTTIAKLKEKRKAWSGFIDFVLAGDYPHLVAYLKTREVIS